MVVEKNALSCWPSPSSRFHKPTLQKSLKDDYLKLKSPMKDVTFTELVQKVEIELSKNQKFEILELRPLNGFRK